MLAFILRRVLIGVFIIWGVYTLTFFAVNLAPGDPFANLENPKMQKEDIDRLRARWGYDKPVVIRYFIHLSKLFWRRDEIRSFESGGIELELFARGGGNSLRARVQAPPNELTLVPTEASRLDSGAAEIHLVRRADGTYPDSLIRPGRYGISKTFFIVGENEAEFETAGLTFRFGAGTLRITPTLEAPPDTITVERRDGQPSLVLERRADGAYGPTAAPGGPYRVGSVDIPVPDEPLESAGLTIDLGTSILNKRPVLAHLAHPIVNSLILAGTALFIDYLIGILIGVLSAIRQNSRLDHGLTVGALFVYSMPSFWFGLMLMLLFAVKLRWLPAEGMHSVGETGLVDLLEHMILPASVLGIGAAAATARYQRSALLEVLGQDYIRTARAKGLPESSVIWKHAMRNALIPVITLLGLTLPFLVSGSVVIETIFSWPGMGREVISAIHGRDVFVVSGVTVIGTTMVIAGNLIADLLYAVVDPRVRLQ